MTRKPLGKHKRSPNQAIDHAQFLINQSIAVLREANQDRCNETLSRVMQILSDELRLASVDKKLPQIGKDSDVQLRPVD
jgi:hypothetical protein